MQLTQKHHEYWNRNLKVTGALLALWFLVTFVMGYFARELNDITILGFPLGFYMAAQGSLIAFVVQLFVFAKQQDNIDREFGVAEDD